MIQLIHISIIISYIVEISLRIVTKNSNKNYNIACVIQNHDEICKSRKKFTNNTSFIFH